MPDLSNGRTAGLYDAHQLVTERLKRAADPTALNQAVASWCKDAYRDLPALEGVALANAVANLEQLQHRLQYLVILAAFAYETAARTHLESTGQVTTPQLLLEVAVRFVRTTISAPSSSALEGGIG